VNLGDKYGRGTRTTIHGSGSKTGYVDGGGTGSCVPTGHDKSLLGLPWRYALACTDELDLVLRRDIIWSKCLSGGTQVYARVNGREKVVMVKDLARCVAGTAELWTGSKWSPMLRCEPTPPTEGRAASSLAARQARYRGRPIPPLAADLEIEFRNGERVGCTPNHKWPTARGIVRADELTVGDVVPIVRLASGSATVGGLDNEMTGWLTGLYIAEGSRSEDMVQIASHIRETERFDRMKIIADAFDGRFALHHTKGNSATANLSGKVIRGIIDTYVGGRTARDKRLSPACWRRSDTFLRALLDGYLHGDGHYETKNDRWILGFTANDGLAVDLRTIAARLGYSLRLRRTVHHFDGRDFPGWSGTLYLEPTRRKRPDGEVIAIRQSRARQFWNIEIADAPHEFALASGILTENSNGIPESVQDRVRTSHEYIFHLVQQQRYFTAVDEIREDHAPESFTRFAPGQKQAGLSRRSDYDGQPAHTFSLENSLHPLGKLPGSVWEFPLQPLIGPQCRLVWDGRTVCWFSTWKEGEAYMRMLARESWSWAGQAGRPSLRPEGEHYAAYPFELCRRVIQGFSPDGICTACGEGRRPIHAIIGTAAGGSLDRVIPLSRDTVHGRDGRGGQRLVRTHGITGYACACPDTSAPTRPSIVLDPFGGTGCTSMVAAAYGRIGITVDYSHTYSRFARWRTNDPDERAKAMQVRKPPPAPDPRQGALFDVGEL